MTTDKLQNNYRITSDPFSEPFVHPTPYRFTLSTDALRALMTKQQKTALNMAKFIQNSTMMRSIFSVHCPRDWMHYRMVTDGQSVY